MGHQWGWKDGWKVEHEDVSVPFQIGKLSHLTLSASQPEVPCFNSTGYFVAKKKKKAI